MKWVTSASDVQGRQLIVMVNVCSPLVLTPPFARPAVVLDVDGHGPGRREELGVKLRVPSGEMLGGEMK